MIHYQRMRWPDLPTWAVYDGDTRLGVVERTPGNRWRAGVAAHAIDHETTYATRRAAATALREREGKPVDHRLGSGYSVKLTSPKLIQAFCICGWRSPLGDNTREEAEKAVEKHVEEMSNA